MNPNWRNSYQRYKSYFLNISQNYSQRTDFKVYLEILLSLFTVTVFAIFALRPTLLTISQLIKEIETKKELIVNINKKLQDVATARAVYNQHISQIQLLDSAVPPTPAVEVFARQLEGLLGNNPLNFASLTTGKATILGAKSNVVTDTKKLETLPNDANGLTFNLGLSTNLINYPNLNRFLADFEHLRIPFKIDNLSLTTPKIGDGFDKDVQLSIGGRIPYLR